MKLFNILTAGVLLCAGLASCEMKDELRGSGEGSSDMGYLDLGVAVNASQNNVSRAGDVTDEGKNENVGVSIPTGDFPVIITNVDDPSNPIEYDKYESFDKLKEENKDGIVALPVGTYTVTAHSNDVLEGEMDVPYYEGTEEINITKDVTSGVEVKCTMKNTKIALSYDTEFIANFTDWTITVTDGTTVLTFECTNNEDVTQLNPAPKYMWVADGVSELTVHASGHNLKGEKVSEERVLTKPAGGNSANWTGGDALTITMEENTPADPTGVQGSGITITADVEFEESDATIEVPVTPGGSTEEPGGGDDDDKEDPKPPVTDENAPTITLPQTTYRLPKDMEANGDVLIQTALKEGSSNEYVGLKSVFVKITPDNEGFKAALQILLVQNIDFMNGVDLIEDAEIVGKYINMIAPGLEMPTQNAKDYKFPVSKFFNTLASPDMGITSNTGHTFEITVTDNNDNPQKATLNIVVESVVESVE